VLFNRKSGPTRQSLNDLIQQDTKFKSQKIQWVLDNDPIKKVHIQGNPKGDVCDFEIGFLRVCDVP
jgi:hypothetical protein